LITAKLKNLELRRKLMTKKKRNLKPLEEKEFEEKEGEEFQKNELPPFPGSKEEFSRSSSEIEKELSEETELTDADILDPVKNILKGLIDLWIIYKPSVSPLSDKEANLLGKPLSRILHKYGVLRYAKDEILFTILTVSVIAPRIKQSQKGQNVTDNSRKEGERKDNFSQMADK